MPMTELAARYLSEWSREWQGALGGARSGKPEVQQKKNQSTLGMFGLMTRVNFCQDISLQSTTHMPKPECFSPWANAKISFVDFETGLQQIDIDINGTQSAAVTPPDSGIYHQTVS